MKYKKLTKLIILLVLIILPILISILNFRNEKINALVLYKSDLEQLQDISSDITANTNIKINYKYMFDDTKDDFDSSNLWKDIENFLSEESNLKDIDVLFNIPYEYKSDLIKNQKLVDLTNKIDKNILENTYKPIIDVSKNAGGGKIFFLSPAYSTQFIITDKNFISKSSKEYILWDEINEELKKKEKGCNIISYGPGGLDGISTDLEILLVGLSRNFIEEGKIYTDQKLENEFEKLITIYKDYGYKKTYADDMDENGISIYNDEVLARVIYPPQLEEFISQKDMSNYTIYPSPTFDGLESTVNIRFNINYSILSSSKKENKSLKVLSYIMSKKFSEKIIKEELIIPSGEFASYIDSDTKELYNKKFNLENTNFIYSGTKGALNKNQFTLKEYYTYHKVNSEIIPEIIEGKISIEDGISKIKKEFVKELK